MIDVEGQGTEYVLRVRRNYRREERASNKLFHLGDVLEDIL